MVDVRSKKCGHHGCTKQPSCGEYGNANRDFCRRHGEAGMVGLTSTKKKSRCTGNPRGPGEL